MGKKRAKVNRKYKDTVFRMLFGENREELLTLYNAVNGSDYKNADDLIINTLKDAVFAGMRNDVSFVFSLQLNLYEHQSTLCPNIPLRDLFYATDLLKEITENMNLFSSVPKKIPTPRFIMFYNGEEDLNGVTEYRLSDLFEKKEEFPQLELIVKIIDVNYGQQNEVLKNCRTMREYAQFVASIREYQKSVTMEAAVTEAMNDCIEKGILADFLRKHRARIMSNILYEYDEKLQRKKEREEGREEGWREGEAERKALAEENHALTQENHTLNQEIHSLSQEIARLKKENEKLRASS